MTRFSLLCLAGVHYWGVIFHENNPGKAGEVRDMVSVLPIFLMVVVSFCREIKNERDNMYCVAFLGELKKGSCSKYRDTAGQERYHSLAPMYYRGASAAVVVYDITHASSFERAKKWVAELRQNVANPALVIALVGNKVDLADQRTLAEADAREYAAEAGLLYFESSAKENINVIELFDTVADK